MKVSDRRALPRTGLELTVLGLGGAHAGERRELDLDGQVEAGNDGHVPEPLLDVGQLDRTHAGFLT